MTCPDGLDRIDLTGIGGWGYHGVHDDERENGQRFVVVSETRVEQTGGRAPQLNFAVNWLEDVQRRLRAIR